MEQRKKVVALIFPPLPAYSRAMTEGIVEKHLGHRGWTIIELPRVAIGQSPLPRGGIPMDGVITWVEPRDQWVHELIANGVRVVNCGAEWAGVPGVASVQFCHDDLHQVVIRHFEELRLRRVVGIGHRLEQRPATRRVLENFARTAETAGMASQIWCLDGEDSPATSPQRLLEPEGEAQLAAFLKSLKKPTGIYCLSDHLAFIVCAVAADCGLRIPEDLAVIGQGDNLVACFSNPPLSSVAGPARAVGLAAANCLAAWLDSGRPPTEPLVISGATLIARESTMGRSNNIRLEATRRFIKEHAVRGMTLGELASLSGLTVKTLMLHYRAAFRIDPLEEIHTIRLAELKRLLRVPRLAISEIASRCGFSSQAALYNYFKRHTGNSPNEFRKEQGV